MSLSVGSGTGEGRRSRGRPGRHADATMAFAASLDSSGVRSGGSGLVHHAGHQPRPDQLRLDSSMTRTARHHCRISAPEPINRQVERRDVLLRQTGARRGSVKLGREVQRSPGRSTVRFAVRDAAKLAGIGRSPRGRSRERQHTMTLTPPIRPDGGPSVTSDPESGGRQDAFTTGVDAERAERDFDRIGPVGCRRTKARRRS